MWRVNLIVMIRVKLMLGCIKNGIKFYVKNQLRVDITVMWRVNVRVMIKLSKE